MLFGLRGTPVLYQGDEIGQGDTVLEPPDAARSARRPLLARVRRKRRGPNADAMERCARRWFHDPRSGALAPARRHRERRMSKSQESDPNSPLVLTRGPHRPAPRPEDLHAGSYTSIPAPDGVWAWRRGERTLVVVNLSDDAATVDVGDGRILLGTTPTRVGEKVSGPLAFAVVGSGDRRGLRSRSLRRDPLEVEGEVDKRLGRYFLDVRVDRDGRT